MEDTEQEFQDSDNSSDDSIISEGYQYSAKSEFNKALIVDDTVRRCVIARCAEMKEGFWNTKITKDGQPIKTWVDDSRKTFISSIEALRSILYPEILGDKGKEYREFENNISQQIEKLYNKYAYEEERPERTKEGRMVWKKINKVMPKIDEIIIRPDPINPNKILTIKGYWNMQVNAYYDSLVDLYDEIFSNLNQLIAKLEYFKSKPSWGI